MAVPAAVAGFKAIAPTLLTIGGTVLGAYGKYQAGEEEKAVADYNAKVQEREAQAEEQRTIVESRRQAEEASRKMAELRAGFGLSGVVSTAGAPLEIVREQERQSELEGRTIGYEGMTATERLREQARQTRYAGKVARRAARIGAGTTLLTGFSSVF